MAKEDRRKGPRLYSRPLRRDRALGYVHEAIELCRFYVYSGDNPPSEKRQWIKTMNGLLSTSSQMMRDVQMDELEKRVTELEEDK